MVKIRIKWLILSIVIFACLMNAAYAVTDSKLIFNHVDAKVGGHTSNNLNNGDTVRDEAKPGDKVEFRVEMNNNFTSAQNLRIRNIIVNVKILSIDDGSDLEEESSEFSLSQGSNKRVTLKFDIPLEVDENNYDVLINAEGEDENGTNHENDMTVHLDLNKDTHKIQILKNTLTQDTINCNRKNVQLAVTLLNTGTDDETDITLEISNSELGLDIKDNVGQLNAVPNEPESRFSKIYRFNVPANVEAGSYPITLRALYDSDRKKAENTATLTVNDCQTTQQENKTQPTVAQQPAAPSQTTQIVQEIPPDTTVSTEGFFSGNGFIIAIVVAEVIAVIVGIVLLISLFGRG